MNVLLGVLLVLVIVVALAPFVVVWSWGVRATYRWIEEFVAAYREEAET